MADEFTSTTEQGLGSNILESIKGVAVGGLLFLVSFIILWMNEGRVDLSEVAKKSVEVKADSVDNGASGKFISVTGPLRAEGKVADPELLNPTDFLRINRRVEMWAWIEKSSTKTKKKLGGKKEKTTTVTYSKGWTDSPDSPSEMEHPEGHENPSLPIRSDHFAADKAFVGAYAFNAGEASMPSGEDVTLTPEMLKGQGADAAADKPAEGGTDAAAAGDEKKAEPADGDKAGEAKDDAAADEKPAKKGKKKRQGRKVKKAPAGPSKTEVQQAERKATAIARRKPETYTIVDGGKYLFRGSGSYDAPQIGDVRISYTALKPGSTATLFGLLEGSEVKPYISKKDDDTRVYRVLNGSRDEALKSLKAEHKAVGWMLRIVGFLCMWIGLMLFFGPINALLDIVPFLGSAGRVLIGIAMLPVSIVLSSVTILLSIIAHSPILLVLVIAAMIGGGVFFYMKKKKAA
ncbi:MAG: TMEM43 family protein [Polyangia bacterium]